MVYNERVCSISSLFRLFPFRVCAFPSFYGMRKTSTSNRQSRVCSILIYLAVFCGVFLFGIALLVGRTEREDEMVMILSVGNGSFYVDEREADVDVKHILGKKQSTPTPSDVSIKPNCFGIVFLRFPCLRKVIWRRFGQSLRRYRRGSMLIICPRSTALAASKLSAKSSYSYSQICGR